MRFGNVDSEYQITAREQPVPNYQRVTNATGLPLNWNYFAVMLPGMIPPIAPQAAGYNGRRHADVRVRARPPSCNVCGQPWGEDDQASVRERKRISSQTFWANRPVAGPQEALLEWTLVAELRIHLGNEKGESGPASRAATPATGTAPRWC
jgi:hypothetical protein